MKLRSVGWLVRYRLLQPLLNMLVNAYQRCYWSLGYPLYKAVHSAAWIIRWRVIRGLANLARTWLWLLRWRVGYPLVKTFYSVVWVLRWRVIRGLANSARTWLWVLRWRVGYPLVKTFYSVVWVLRWRVIRGTANRARSGLWVLRWRVGHPLARKLHSIRWILRWRVAFPIVHKLRSMVWIWRWRVVYPIVKKFYSAKWILRWRVLRPLANYLRYLAWYVRWRLLYPLLKSVVPTAVLRVLYPARARGLVQFLKDLRIESIALLSFGQYAAQSRVVSRQLAAPEAVVTPQAQVFPHEDSSFLGTTRTGFRFPAVSVITLEGATVFGRSNMVFAHNALLHHDLYQFTHDFTSEELHGKIRVLPVKNLVKPYEAVTHTVHYPQAALFMDSCSSNYAHWLTEVLPRINAFRNGLTPGSATLDEPDSSGVNPSMPLLVDAGLHANIEASLLAVIGEAAHVIRVANCTDVQVDRLLITTPTGYVPFDRRSNNLQGHSEGVFSPKALQALRDHLAAVLPMPLTPMPKRIFLKRNTKARAMLNADDVEKRLLMHGFESVSTELLSFAEQFHLFAGAETVVGATGAAFANLIFCKPTAKIVICIAKFENTSYGYWQNLACASGNRVSYVFGKIAPALIKSIHSDFMVDELDVLNAIA